MYRHWPMCKKYEHLILTGNLLCHTCRISSGNTDIPIYLQVKGIVSDKRLSQNSRKKSLRKISNSQIHLPWPILKWKHSIHCMYKSLLRYIRVHYVHEIQGWADPSKMYGVQPFQSISLHVIFRFWFP